VVLITGAHDAAAPELVALLLEAPDVPSRVVFDASELLHQPLGARVVLVDPGPHARWLNLHRPVVRQRRLTVLLWCRQSCVEELKRGAPDFMDWISHRLELPPMLPGFLVEALSAFESRGQILGLINAPPAPSPWRTISALTPYETLRDACRKGPIWVTDVGDALSWLGARIAHVEGGGKHGLILADPRVIGDGDPWLDAQPVPWREAARRLEAHGVAEPGLLAALKGMDPKALDMEQAGPLNLAIDPHWKTILAFAREAPDAASIRLASELELVSVVETWLKEVHATTDFFFGRTHELVQLTEALLPTAGPPRPVALHGMAGVGKSFLVAHFAREYAKRFPGGYHVLALEPDSAPSVDTLGGRLATLIGQRTWSPGAWGELVARLRSPAALVHVENVDSDGPVDAVVELANRLTGCALVVSGRSRRFDRQPPFQVLEIQPMDEPTALALLAAELGPARNASGFAERRRLVRALGYLPLALHLAAGYLADGHNVGGFLERLRVRGLALEPAGLAGSPDCLDQRFALSTTLALSLDLLARRVDAAAMAGFAVLGHAPGAGVRGSLGAAMAGLEEGTFDALMVEAVRLSLASARADAGWSIHPLLAELLRGRVPDGAWLDRMTAWFVARLPARPPGEEDAQGRCWGEIQREGAALEQWLPQVSDADLTTVERAGSKFAVRSGPFRVWMTFCERVLERVEDPQARSNALWTLAQVASEAGDLERAADAAQVKRSLDLERGEEREATLAMGLQADILQARGEIDEALRIRREEELPVYERLGDVRSRAVTMGKVADILEARGELDEALRIRREEELPVYERLGDVRSRAVTMGQVADILEARGELNEALRIRREEELPVYERLGDVRSRAVTMGQVADILEARGELDEALRILKQEVLPAFERLGDVRSRAVTMGQVADILEARGELDEALRILREELPVYERLGDVRSRAVTMGKVADILEARGELDEALRILREEELPVYERLGDVRSRAVTMGKVADILEARGELDEALRIRRDEELPVYERLGDVRSRAVTMGKVADILEARGELDEALRIRREEQLPVYERLGDARSRAVTMGKVADILLARGELDEALRILREEELPVYERLGDVRSRAVTMGKVADILLARGELDEALRIRREEELPVYERLGDVRELLVGRTNLAITLLRRGQQADQPEIGKLLVLALRDARRLRLPEAQGIASLVRRLSGNPDAPPFVD